MIDSDSIRRGTTAAALVSQMAVLTVLGGLGGQQLDERFLTEPKLQTTGFVLGFSIGLTTFLLFTIRNTPDTNSSDNDETPPDPPL